MKTSKIILIITATAVILGLIVFALILHNTILVSRSGSDFHVACKTVPMGDFDKLALSSNLNVRIRQGKECLVEFASDADSLKHSFVNVNGTLQLAGDSIARTANALTTSVRITMPLLREINADHYVEIQMGFFQADSIGVILGEGCVFNGNNNTFKHVSFKTSGDALIKISNTF